MSGGLEPLDPATAVELYMDHRKPELSAKSLTNHRYRLDSFVTWCEEQGLENLNELTGRHLHQFRIARTEGTIGDYQPVGKVTLQGILATLRVFLEFCASIDAVEQGMRERVLIPEVSPEDESREVLLEEDRAREIIEHLERFEYASRKHVIFAILWHTGIRLGTLRSFDVSDFDADSRCLDVRHREKTETPLKNRKRAERSIAIGEHYVEVLQDYIEHNRHDVQDDYGRSPLITSREGRYSETGIRDLVYRTTRPCLRGPCPHDRDPETCEAMESAKASRCPSSRSPHGIRRGAITKHLREGTPEEIVSDRMNVSREILDKHYDERSEREKMELRREFITES